jgi:hypothetical protein
MSQEPMLFKVAMEIQPLLYQRNQKLFLILMFVMQMSFLRIFLSDCLLVFVMVPVQYPIVLRQVKALLLTLCSSMS